MRKFAAIAVVVLIAAGVDVVSNSASHGTTWILEQNRAKFGRPFTRPPELPRALPKDEVRTIIPDSRAFRTPRNPREPNADFPVEANWSLKGNQEAIALQKRMAKAIDGFSPVPKARLDFYARHLDPNEFDFYRWRGIIRSVEPKGGGFLVRIHVNPELSLFRRGGVIALAASYVEVYEVDGESVRYLRSEDPRGESGKRLSWLGL